MAIINVNGVQLFVQTEGKGVPVVLLHGLGRSHLSWSREIEVWKDRFLVVAIDSRGHGQSDKPAKYTLRDHISDVIFIADHFGFSSFHLMGTSMGSYIAQGIAATVPERVNKLVLVSTKCHGRISSSQAFRERYAEEMKNLNEQERELFVINHIYHNKEAVLTMLPLWERDRLTLQQQEAANQAIEGFDFRPDLPKVTAPTLVISGRYDTLNPPSLGRECASLIPNAKFIEMTGSGHAPNLEEHQCFIKIVTDFLGGIMHTPYP